MDYAQLALEAVKTAGIIAAAVSTTFNHQRLKRVSQRTKEIAHAVNAKNGVTGVVAIKSKRPVVK